MGPADYIGSTKLDAAVLEAKYDAVTEAFQVLPIDVLQKLLKPMSTKAKPGTPELARKQAKTEGMDGFRASVLSISTTKRLVLAYFLYRGYYSPFRFYPEK